MVALLTRDDCLRTLNEERSLVIVLLNYCYTKIQMHQLNQIWRGLGLYQTTGIVKNNCPDHATEIPAIGPLNVAGNFLD